MNNKFQFLLCKNKTDIGNRAEEWCGLKKMLLLGFMLVSGALRAQPVVSSLSATSGAPGSSITITGTGFNTTTANNVVYFGATRATVTAASATSLAVTVSAGATYAPVSVTNIGTALTGTSRKVFSPTFNNSLYISGTFNFEPQKHFGGLDPYSAYAMDVADIDGDGKTDIAITQGNLSVMKNANTTGYLDPGLFGSAAFTLDTSGVYQAIEDINGDGKKDIIVSINTGGFSVFRNISASGSITSSSMAARVDFAIGGNGMLAVADFNGDGKPDIAQANTEDHIITIFQNTSSGATISFAAGVSFATDHGANVIRVADIDGDGKADIITDCNHVWAWGDPLPANPSGFSIFHNVMSSGAISTASLARIDYGAAYDAISYLTLADIDIDGKPDIVVLHTSIGSSNCTIYENNTSAGSITSTSFSSTGFNFGDFKGIGDLDGDGRPEIISSTIIEYDYPDYTYLTGVHNYSGNFLGAGSNYMATTSGGFGIAIYRNTSTTGVINTSSFSGATKFYDLDGNDGLGSPYFSDRRILNVFVADMDGDGKPDICAGRTYDVAILRNNPLKPPSTVTSISAVSGHPGSSVTISGTNFNPTAANNSVYFGATKANVTSASATALNVTVPLGATYDPVSVTNMTLGFTAFSPAPFLASFDHSAYTPGTIEFDPKADISLTYINISVTFGDVDGDGKPDMLIQHGAAVSVYRNISTSGSITPGSFAAPVDFPVAGNVTAGILFHDIDMDGKADIVAGCSDGSGYGSFSILRNTATAGTINTSSFATHVDIPAEAPGFVDIGDVDGDGKPEIVFCSGMPGALVNNFGMLQNRSIPGIIDTNSFGHEVALDIVADNTVNIKLRDMDGDGKNDLVITDFFMGISVYRNMSRQGAIVGTVDFWGFSPYHLADRAVLQCFATAVGAGPLDHYRGQVTGDIDGDGKQDVVYSNDSALIVIRNTSTAGAISFASPVSFNAGKVITDIKLGDMDGDDKPDIICAYQETIDWSDPMVYLPDSGILVFRNLSASGSFTSGSLAAPKQFKVASTPGNIFIEDIDGDGKSDIVANCFGIYTDSIKISMLRNDPQRIIGPDNLCVGATASFTDGIATGTWSSSSTPVATIGSSTGIVTGVSSGTVVISFNHAGGVVTKIVTVGVAPAAITGALTVCQSATTTLSDITSGGIWNSGNTAVAAVGSATGIVSGVAGGTAIVTYFTGCGTGAVATVTVTPLPGVSAILNSAISCTGTTNTLGNTYSGGVWTSSDPSVATIGSSSGIVNPVALGTSIITYAGTNTCGTVTVTRVQSVNTSPSGITGTPTLCVGSTTALTSAPSGGFWTSNTIANATIGSATGIVTGVHSGTSFIVYNLYGCYATTTVTVSSATVGAGTVTGTATVCAGATTTLSDAVSGGTWSSANTSVATVGTGSGIVSGVAAGTAIISYTVTQSCGSATATRTVTVGTTPSAGTITGTATVCVPGTTTLSDAVTGGVWSSSIPAVGTISSSGVVTASSAGTTTISYTVTDGCGSASATMVVTANLPVSAGTITGSSAICLPGSATLSDAFGGGVWSSSTLSVATVGSSGIVTAVGTGTSTISYTVSGSCGTATATMIVTVNPGASAGTISGLSSVAIGSSIMLTDAVSGGIWSASNSHATVSGGVVTGVSAGTVTISYSVTNSCGTAIATKVISVGSSLDPISGTLTVCAGATTMLSDVTFGGLWGSSNVAVATVNVSGMVTGVAAGTATITYSLGGSTVSVVVTVNALPAIISGPANVCLAATTTLSDAATGGTWSSNNASIASAGMSTGIITGATTGTTTITYTLPTGCYRTLSMTVKPLPAAITGAASICPGSSTTYSDATTGGLSWSSSSPSVGTIGATSGVFTAITTGVTTITYTLISGCTATKTISVNAIPAAISGASSTCAGSTATLTDADAGGTWSSTVAGVATIGSTGIVTAVGAGATNIMYSTGAGCNRSLGFTVNPLPATITGGTTLCAGSTTVLTNATTGGTWTSGTTSVATISAGGIVSGAGTGTSVISYALGTGCLRTTTVNVSGAISAITGALSTCVGTATTLANATSGGTWSSSNAVIASVSASGAVTGASSGMATITYTVGGCRAVAVVTISASIPVITGIASVCVNAGTTLSNAAAGGVWSSSNPALGTVSASGVVTGIAAGTPTISYVLGGCYRTVNVTVKALPGTISGNTGICVGGTSTVTDGTGVSWSSSTPSVATIGAASGVITGISAGTSVITFNASNGCIATKVATVDAAPSVSAITGPAGVAIGHTITLANATPGGVWSSNNTAKATVSAGGVVTGIAVPAVTISYTVTNGVCSIPATKLISITASRPAGMLQASEDPATIKVYPNPSSGTFTVETSVQGTFIVYTLEGKEVQRNEVSEGPNMLSLPKGLAAGIYMCRFNGGDDSTVMVRLVYE